MSNFKCDVCNKKSEELHSLTEYGERRYGIATYGKEFCGKCFEKFVEKEIEEKES